MCGSQSLTRDDPGDDGLIDLKDIDWDPNRAFLGRLPLLDRGEGVLEPVGVLELIGERPRVAVMMKLDEEGGPIRAMLREDPLLGPFVDIPCKENGLDVEGLAAKGDTVWLGLRGPVLGGCAISVEMRFKTNKQGARLKPRKYENGARYRLIALDLEGHAIRDLLYEEDALYILSGATTDLEALQAVYRIDQWPTDGEVIKSSDMTRVVDLPAIRGSDHAEGLEFLRVNGKRQFVIAFDSPEEARVEDATQSIAVDIYDDPER